MKYQYVDRFRKIVDNRSSATSCRSVDMGGSTGSGTSFSSLTASDDLCVRIISMWTTLKVDFKKDSNNFF